MRNFLALILPLILVFACEEPDPGPEPDKLTTENGSFFQMEVAQLSLKGEKVGTGTVEGMLDEQPIEIHLYDTLITFIIPDISPGAYKLTALHEGKQLTGSVTVNELKLSSTPEEIFQQTVDRNTESINRLTTLAESLSEADKSALLEDVKTISGWLVNLRSQYANLSSDEKVQFAKTIAANQWWIDEVHTVVTEFSKDADSNKRTSLAIEDWEARLMNSSRLFVNATIALVAHVPKIAAMATLGALTGSVVPGIGTGIGAAIGAGVEIGEFLLSYEEHTGAMHGVLDDSIIPVMKGYEHWRIADKTVIFVSKVAKEINTSTNYRSLYGQDENSGPPIASTFSSAFKATEGAWESISPLLPSPLNAPPKLEEVKDYSMTERDINSKYLEISDISNDNVELLKEEDENGRKVLTFENKTSTDQEFTYKVTYTNGEFASDLSLTVSAIVHPSVTIVGKWSVTSNMIYSYDKKDGELIGSEVYDDILHHIEFTNNNKALFYWDPDPNEVSDEGNYSWDEQNSSITISNTREDEYPYTYKISDLTSSGFVMKVDGQHENGTYVVLEIVLNK